MPTFNEILNNRKLKNQYQGYEKYANVSDSGASFDSVMSKRAKRKIEDKLQVLGTKANSLYKEYNSRYFDKDGNYLDAYKEDSEEWKNSVAKQTTSLDSDAREIGDMLIRYKDSFDDDTFSKLSESLQKEQDKFLNISKHAVSQNELFSNYSSDEEYQTAKKNYALDKKWNGKFKSYADLSKYLDSVDIKEDQQRGRISGDDVEWLKNHANTVRISELDAEATKKELEEVKTQIAEWNRNVKTVSQLHNGDDEINALKARRSQLERDLYDYDNYLIQKSAEENSVKDDFKEFSQYIPKEKGWLAQKAGIVRPYEYINMPKEQQESPEFGSSAKVYKDEYHYNLMTDEEIANYNYLYNTQGEQQAGAYLNSIQETLNARSARSTYKDFEGDTLKELTFSVAAGLDQFGSGIKQAVTRKVQPTSDTQMLSSLVREDLSDEMVTPEWLGGFSAATTLYDLGTTVANMAPSIAISAALTASGVGAPLGAVVGTATMGLSAGGNAYNEMVKAGYAPSEAANFGALTGASEAILQYLLGGVGKLGGAATKAIGSKITSKLGSTAVSKVGNVLKNVAVQTGLNLVGEGIEEYLQEILTPVFKNVCFDENNEFKLFTEEALYSGIMGMLTAGGFSAVTDVPAAVKENKALNTLGKNVFNKNNLGELIELGINADTSSDFYKLATKISQSKNVTNADIGKLQTAAMEHSGAEVRNVENKKITEATVNRLVELGAEPEQAENLANVVLKSYRGEVLTAEESNLLANSKEANRTVSELVNEDEKYSSDWVSAVKKDEDILNARAQARKILNSPKIKKVSITENGINVSDINTVEVKGDEIVVNGQDANDLSFLNEQTAELVALSSNYGSAAQHFIDTYKLQPTEDIVEFALAYDLAHDYGKVDGINLDYAQNNPELSALSAEQIEAAYKAGETAAQLKQSQTVFKKRKNKIESGVVKLAPSISYNSLSSKQKASIRALRSLSGLTGIRFEVFRSQMDSNGEYTEENGSYKNGTIRLDINAGKDNFFDGEVAIISTASHELTHFLREYDPEGYKALQTFVIEHIGKDITELANKHIAEYASQGKEIDFEDAVEEIVAESCTQTLKDSSALEKLAKENRTLFEKIVDFLKELFRDIRKAYEGTALTPEAEAMLKHMDELQKLWDASLVKAVENYKSNKAIKKSTDKNGGVKMQLRGFTKDGRRVYETDFTDDIPMDERIKLFKDRIATIFNLGAVELKTDVKKIKIEGDKFTAQKNLYGDTLPTEQERKAKVNALYDMADILATSKYVPSKTSVEASYSNPKVKPKNAAHKGVKYWYKFQNEIVFDDVPFSVTFNIRDKGKNQYEYLIEFKENKTPGLSNTVYKDLLRTDQVSNNRLSQKQPIVNTQYMQKSNNDTKKLSIRRRNDAYTALGEMKTLEKRNQKLEQDVAELRQLLSLQSKLTHSNELNPRQLRTAADIIRKRANSTYSTDDITKRIGELYRWIAKGEDISWAEIYDRARPIAEDIANSTRETKQKNQYFVDLAKRIHNTTFSLNEKQIQEVEYEYGSLEAFRKHNMGRFTLKKDAAELDVVWQELALEYPGVFDTEINDADMPLTLVDIYTGAKASSEYVLEVDKNEQIAAIVTDIYDMYWNVSTLKTVADKKQQEISKLKAKHKEKIEDIKQKNKIDLAKNKSENQEKLNKVIEFKNKQIEDVKNLGNERLKKQRDRVKKNAAIKKIYNRLNEFSKKIEHPTVKKHLPSSMVGAVAELCDVFNYNTLEGKKIKYRVANFLAEYNELKKQESDVVIYDENVESKIQDLKELVGDKTFRELELSELEQVYETIRMISYQITNANKAFTTGRNETIEQAIFEVANELKSKQNKSGHKVILKGIRKIGWKNMKPEYLFRMIGSDKLTELYHNLRKSEDTWAEDMQEAKTTFEKAIESHNIKFDKNEKPKTFKTRDGDLQLTTQQIMFLYAASKRKAYLEHLDKGGLVFSEDVVVKGKKKNGKDTIWSVTMPTHPFRLNALELANITATLTNEQRAFVDELQHYLSHDLSKKGNSISRALYDIDIFKEENYWPIVTDKNYLLYNPQTTDVSPKLKNSGMTKETKPHASNPVVIGDFTEIWGKHVNQMSMYHATVLPMEDFSRVFGYSQKTFSDTDNNSATSIRGIIKEAYTDEAVQTVTKLLQDINGGMKTNDDGTGSFFNKASSKFKKASVFANLSVAIQQPSAIVRATALVDTKYFLKSEFQKPNWEEVKKYAPVAVVKEMGRFDPAVSQSAVSWLTSQKPKGLKDKAGAFFSTKDSSYRDDIFTWLPGKLDEITWSHIWNAVKLEVADKENYQPNSEEYFKACGERFTEVITRTQVYDSVFSRSEFMRSTNGLTQMATAFMSEPTTAFNMLLDAIVQGRRLGLNNKEGLKYLSRSVLAVVCAGLYNAFLKSWVTAARDDDEDKTYAEKYISEFSGNFLESLNPTNMIPIVKDIVSIFSGYEVQRTDMTVINDFKKAIDSCLSETKSGYEKIKDISGAVSNMCGIPVENVWRDIEAVYNIFFKSAPLSDPSGRSIGTLLWEGVVGEPSQKERIKTYGKYISSGEYGKAESLIATMRKEKTNARKRKYPEENEKERNKEVNSSMRALMTSYYKQEYISGNETQRSRIKTIMLRSGIYGNSYDVNKTCKEWIDQN